MVTGFVPEAEPVSVPPPIFAHEPPEGVPRSVRRTKKAPPPYIAHVFPSSTAVPRLIEQRVSEYKVAVGTQVGAVATPHWHAVHVKVLLIPP